LNQVVIMLWIAIHLPYLPLEALPSPAPVEPRVVTDGTDVLVCNPEAQARGVRDGMRLSAACALLPGLHYHLQNPAAEAAALDTLAAWAGQFTPNVSLEPPHALLLDIEGSLGLLGGIRNILRVLRHGLDEMHFSAVIACAPNPTAALLLARGGREVLVNCKRMLEEAIVELPIAVLACNESALETFDALGVRRLSDLLALPRDGLARRFGPPLLDTLDRALGKLPAPRRFFTPPVCFAATLELAAPASESTALLFAARRLATQLAGFLAARDGGIQRCTLALLHEKGRTETNIDINLVAPTRDSAHLIMLMRERFAALALKAPVHALRITADEILALTGENRVLFADHVNPAGEWEKLVERLRARLGEKAVHGVAPQADHRPERAWRITRPGTKNIMAGNKPRPLWLLAQPQPLGDSRPHYRNSPLALIAGPERIESGWWDENPVKRDYFVAHSADHATLWIYQERRRPGGWYLHGIFG
jgi:protein ImuB